MIPLKPIAARPQVRWREPPDLRPMEEAEARQYLEANGFLERERFRPEKLFSAATGLSALLEAAFPENAVEDFLDAVFEEQTALAARSVSEAYWIIGEPVPEHLTALAAFPDAWLELISITAILLEDKDDPSSGPGKAIRISELLKNSHDTKAKKGTK
jgi:hypothetical protein